MVTRSPKSAALIKGADGLTPPQKAFVDALVSDPEFSIKDAAAKAGFKHPAQSGSRLLNNPAVRRAIGRIQQRRNAKSEITNERVLLEVEYLAFRDLLDMEDAKTGIVNLSGPFALRNLPERLRRCIDGLDIKQHTNHETGVTTQEIKVKLVPKVVALELYMKHRGLFEPQKGELKISLDLDALYRQQKAPNVLDSEVIERPKLPAYKEPETPPLKYDIDEFEDAD